MKKRNIIVSLILISILIPFCSAGLFDWFKEKVQLGPSADTNVRLQVGNAAPQITYIDLIPAVDLIPNSTTSIIFNFTARDPNGASDLDNTKAWARFTRGAEPIRYSSCTFVLEQQKSRTFQCSVPMEYYDEAGSWALTVSINDTMDLNDQDTGSLTINLLRDILLAPATITFPTVAPGMENATADQNTTTINQGNAVVPPNTLSVTAYDLLGETTPSESIPSANFTIGNPQSLDVCQSGNVLSNSSTVTITSSALPRGPSGSNTAEIAYCLIQVPDGISSQYYSTTTSGLPWTITLN